MIDDAALLERAVRLAGNNSAKPATRLDHIISSFGVGAMAACHLLSRFNLNPSEVIGGAPKCPGCGGHGLVGGLLPNGGGYDSDECSDCHGYGIDLDAITPATPEKF